MWGTHGCDCDVIFLHFSANFPNITRRGIWPLSVLLPALPFLITMWTVYGADQAPPTIGPLSLLKRSWKQRHLQISTVIYFDLAELDLQLVSCVCDRFDVLNVKHNRNLMTVVFNLQQKWLTQRVLHYIYIMVFLHCIYIIIWKDYMSFLKVNHGRSVNDLVMPRDSSWRIALLLLCICFRRKLWMFRFK